MILDKQNLCSDNQSAIAATGTYVSTNSIDLWGGASAQPTDTLGNTVLSDPGRAGKVRLFMMVNTTCVGATATVIMRLITATDAALTAGIVALEADPARTQSMTGFKWINSISLNAS